ncbi:MAG: PAS domain S-box protein [Richelia sp. RM2_1_2]|nr:PAS domain S-box protein [Richelia sp. RM2_1_2]
MMRFFGKSNKQENIDVHEAEKTIIRSQENLEAAASGTKLAVLDLIGDLKTAVEGREKKYQILVENIQDGMYILRDRKFIFANKALCEMIGVSRSEILGKTLKELVTLTDNYAEMISTTSGGHREYTIRYCIKNTTVKKIVTVWETISYDRDFTIEMGCEEADNPGHECEIAIGTVKDVTDAEEKEHMLRAFSSAINDSSDVMMMVSFPGSIMFVNSAFEKTYGFTLQEVAGQNPSILKSGLHGADFYKKMWDTLLCGQEWRGVVFNKAKDGTIVEDETKVLPFMNGSDVPMFFMAIKKVRRVYVPEEAQLMLHWSQGKLD